MPCDRDPPQSPCLSLIHSVPAAFISMHSIRKPKVLSALVHLHLSTENNCEPQAGFLLKLSDDGSDLVEIPQV